MAKQGHEPAATEVKAYIRNFQNFHEHCTCPMQYYYAYISSLSHSGKPGTIGTDILGKLPSSATVSGGEGESFHLLEHRGVGWGLAKFIVRDLEFYQAPHPTT